jgi:hypothetical protein
VGTFSVLILRFVAVPAQDLIAVSWDTFLDDEAIEITREVIIMNLHIRLGK